MTNYAIDRNYPTKLTGNDFQWVNGKLVDTNNMQDPYVVNSLLSKQAQTGPTGGLAATDYANRSGNDFSTVASKDPSESFGDKVSRWFTPAGDKGTSLGGNVMGAVGTGVDALTGLAGLYYTKKNYDLQKEQADYLKGRDAASDARKSKFAANAGNGASY